MTEDEKARHVSEVAAGLARFYAEEHAQRFPKKVTSADQDEPAPGPPVDMSPSRPMTARQKLDMANRIVASSDEPSGVSLRELGLSEKEFSQLPSMKKLELANAAVARRLP